ncbi:MAG TPA: hypothetical protein VNF93_02380 [Buchnera sp. (in: enterobacteria)]|nr:hypothetical protein [Buchnera sp. (in: enterobacteria)]
MNNFTHDFLSRIHPVCAICDKKVDTIKFRDNIMTNKIHLSVSCHGYEEEIVIDHNDFIYMQTQSARPGIAFSNIKLSSNNNNLLMHKGN